MLTSVNTYLQKVKTLSSAAILNPVVYLTSSTETPKHPVNGLHQVYGVSAIILVYLTYLAISIAFDPFNDMLIIPSLIEIGLMVYVLVAFFSKNAASENNYLRFNDVIETQSKYFDEFTVVAGCDDLFTKNRETVDEKIKALEEEQVQKEIQRREEVAERWSFKNTKNVILGTLNATHNMLLTSTMSFIVSLAMLVTPEYWRALKKDVSLARLLPVLNFVIIFGSILSINGPVGVLAMIALMVITITINNDLATSHHRITSSYSSLFDIMETRLNRMSELKIDILKAMLSNAKEQDKANTDHQEETTEETTEVEIAEDSSEEVEIQETETQTEVETETVETKEE